MALRDHPRGFWFVFWGELAERASYYGMRTLLALFLLDVLHFSRNESGKTVQFFMASCYLLPLLGGFIADNYLGKYKTILYFSIPYILGHFLLGGSTNSVALYIALGLLALGSGTIKPNTTPLMGMIYEKENKTPLLNEAFSLFYAAINIGAVATSWALPLVRNHYGYRVALMGPTLAMVLAMAFFAMGKKYYPTENVRKLPAKTPEQRKEEREVLIRVSGIFLLIAAFWLVYDQSASTWVFFAKDHMDLRLWPFNMTITPDQVQALNPLFIVVLTPFFIWLWKAFDRAGKPVAHTKKMMIGFLITSVCMGAMALAGFLSNAGKVSVWWIIIATFVITLSELCVSVVGMEFAYLVATPRTKSTVTAAFWLTVFVGDFTGGIFAGHYEDMSPGMYFGSQAVLLVGVTVLFYFVAKKFRHIAIVEPSEEKAS
jgi:POT family proton-dependent oligopeptide transporter